MAVLYTLNMKILLFPILASAIFLSTMSFASAQNATLYGNTANTSATSSTNSMALDPTTIVITQNSSKVSIDSSVQLTATVTDMSNTPTAPTGTVSWNIPRCENCSGQSSCTLVPNNADLNESTCNVNYFAYPSFSNSTPQGTYSIPVTIIASYQGDGMHQAKPATENLMAVGQVKDTMVNVVTNETQVTAGSPVQITVTLTNSSGSIVSGPGGIGIGVIAANGLNYPHPPGYVQKSVNIGGVPVDTRCITDNIAPQGGFCDAYVRGNVSSDSCPSSTSGTCTFTYTPPAYYNGPVMLMAAGGDVNTMYPYKLGIGNVTIQVIPPTGVVQTYPQKSYENTIVAQQGGITVRFASSFGSPGFDDGQMAVPQGIALDQSGDIYVAQEAGKRVDKFDSSGNLVSKIGVGILTSPTNVAVDNSGNEYVVDIDSGTVYKFDSSGNVVSKFEPFGKCDIGNPTAHNIEPQGIVVDSQGNVYLTDLCDIQKYDPSGNLVLTFGSHGTSNGQLTGTGDITVDKSGNIYVADTNQRIDKFNSSGKFLGWIGNCRSGTNCNSQFQNTTGFCTDCTVLGARGSNDGQFRLPQGVAVDQSGNIWITDEDNQRIQVFDSSGKFLFAFGSSGYEPGQFNQPNGLALDNDGNLYVADQSNGRVQIFHIDYTGGSSSSMSSQSAVTPQSTTVQPATQQQTTTVVSNQTSTQLYTVPTISSISKAPGWVKDIFSFHEKGEISDSDLISTVSFLIQHGIVKLQ